ncbi:MAG: hypothetical protein QG552_3786 [Thermodesulfobacteriota bacterium]|nr:hypothetical protein [Thermodesulfobacteriota bacterium]
MDVDVLELIDEDSVRLIKIKATLKENWVLYITELHTRDWQKYSYHCQRSDGEVMVRWDNKPHWKEMATFPHHKHEGSQVVPSHRVTIVDVLEEVEKRLG